MGVATWLACVLGMDASALLWREASRDLGLPDFVDQGQDSLVVLGARAHGGSARRLRVRTRRRFTKIASLCSPKGCRARRSLPACSVCSGGQKGRGSNASSGVLCTAATLSNCGKGLKATGTAQRHTAPASADVARAGRGNVLPDGNSPGHWSIRSQVTVLGERFTDCKGGGAVDAVGGA